MGDQAPSALFDEAEGQALCFLFKRSKAEASRNGLRDDETAVLEQEFAGLLKCAFAGSGSNFFQTEWFRCGLA